MKGYPMKTPLEDNLNKAYETFTRDHDQLRQRLMALLAGRPTAAVSRKRKFIGDIILKSRMTKLGAAAVIIIAALIGINRFGGSIDGNGAAFGKVLGYIQTFSYTFDLTVTTPELEHSEVFTMQAMILELGRLRIDWPTGTVGKISSITDFNTNKTLLLFHENKTAAVKTEPVLNKSSGAGEILAWCTKPIENLWNVRDGTEHEMGQKQINGQTVTGFRVFQENEHFQYDITIWADSETGVPSLVEAIAEPLEAIPEQPNECYTSMKIKWTLENFDLDVELDEQLFSLEVPAGYTLAYQSHLDRMQVETEPSVESEKIVQMLELWTQGRKDEAIEILLRVDWAQPIEFGKEPYIFSATERGYIALNAEDQERLMAEIMDTAVKVRNIVYEVLDLARNAVSAKQYEQAERYFEAALQLGKLVDRNPDAMIIVRLVGIAVEKKTLGQMLSLYTTINDTEKLQAAQEQLRAAEADAEQIKKKALGK
jgi:tetratricopeptide (TPR) repeat protein